MTEFSIIISAIIFISVLLLSNRYFYFLELKAFTNRVSRTLGLDVLQLDYSFEQMVYFISLPSNIPVIKKAKQEDILIKCVYTSLFFPRLSGIKILIKSNEENRVVAYLPIKDFRLPTLDRIQEEGKINESSYLKISTYKLSHSTTLKEISEEVFKQIHGNQ
ncbi:hypothetical protein [Neobacillus sp. D3-1R]|uniref:hypothetical protein n=1 Tax=Neobacillus sp. D3-1R TaxID=3445778 RepID=UPI003F9F56DD